MQNFNIEPALKVVIFVFMKLLLKHSSFKRFHLHVLKNNNDKNRIFEFPIFFCHDAHFNLNLFEIKLNRPDIFKSVVTWCYLRVDLL